LRPAEVHRGLGSAADTDTGDGQLHSAATNQLLNRHAAPPKATAPARDRGGGWLWVVWSSVHGGEVRRDAADAVLVRLRAVDAHHLPRRRAGLKGDACRLQVLKRLRDG